MLDEASTRDHLSRLRLGIQHSSTVSRRSFGLLQPESARRAVGHGVFGVFMLASHLLVHGDFVRNRRGKSDEE